MGRVWHVKMPECVHRHVICRIVIVMKGGLYDKGGGGYKQDQTYIKNPPAEVALGRGVSNEILARP
jgi:hypothetical protein